ncbi:hypothetical protein [Yersinia phage vB_YenM_P778]
MDSRRVELRTPECKSGVFPFKLNAQNCYKLDSTILATKVNGNRTQHVSMQRNFSFC